ncbi:MULTISPECIES: glycoside hydrolase family 43 protein [unclassified Butyrivibrio]|uniref:glycoside hydrolase family 43 protein n=1 Tax=unclassified Butyrivibrio TaxID=2639466 RepID=UPI0003F57E8E|nr:MULTISPECIES: glycoside hydrolase family 43 protein [unclassified Butyrivibrio]
MQVLEVSTMEEMFKGVKLSPAYKKYSDHNPVMTQRYGADPYVLVYDGRVYLYMTGDDPMYDENGELKENTYGNINKINVVSSADLVNWTDHGTIYAASETGAAKWGANSWAPAAAYKNIDGKDKFFLYFANNGNGIAVLTADSPVGPFTDPINGPLISRETPNCAEVTWLFDPAVLMDDDGSAYLYVGGGVPCPEKASNPGTARVVKLGADMISLDGDPQPIENVAYLFEDSGINKMGGKYYYSYCSNFSMTPEAEKERGFEQGEIITLVSDSPMGPFKHYKPVLKNPEFFFGLGGNNHHCMFEFKNQWYITYHSRILEEAKGKLGGYRSTNIDVLQIEDNAPSVSKGTKAGVKQLSYLNPYEEVKAVTMSNCSGIDTVQYGDTAEECGSGDMIVTGIEDGSWLSVTGADFGNGGAFEVSLEYKGRGTGAVRVSLDSPEGPVLAYVPVEDTDGEVENTFVSLEMNPDGVHDLFFTFVGKDYDMISWRFIK